MNVLPAAPPAPAPSTSTSTRSRDRAPSFEHILGEKVASRAGIPVEDVPEEAAGAEPGAVAAAVHAAVAAWRADPAGVALGTHLHEALQQVVGQVLEASTGTSTEPADVTISGPAPPVDPAILASAAAIDMAPADTSPLLAVPDDGDAKDVAASSEQPTTLPPPLADEPPSDAVVPPPVGDLTPTGAAPTRSSSDVPNAEAPSSQGATTAVATTAVSTGAPTSVPVTPTDETAGATVTGRAEPVPAPQRRDETVGRAMPAHDTAEVGTTSVEAPSTSVRSGAAPTTASAPAPVLDRVLRAVEALEHAPPPRRLALELEGVRLTVALQGDDVRVVVRAGGDQLGSGWQRDLDALLRERGLTFTFEQGDARRPGSGHPGGDGRRDEGRGRPPAMTTPPASPATRPHAQARPAGVQL